jgi:hypothetical protein
MQLFKALLFSLGLCGCVLVPTFAQSQPDTLKNEIGFGTDILLKGLFNSNAAPFDFMYRRQSGSGYLRLGLSLFVSSSSNFQQNYQSYGNYVRPELTVGKAWRQAVHKRWMVNYGGDFKGEYHRNSGRSIYEYPDRPGRESIDLRETYGLGIRPFFGLIFKISERLYLNAEASVLTKVERVYASSGRYEIVDGNRGEYQEDAGRTGWHYHFNTFSASNIFVYYRF